MAGLLLLGALLLLLPLALYVCFALLRKATNPEKSLYYCFVNTALYPLRALRLGPYKDGTLTLQRAMSYAVKKTKLSDFGDRTFVDSYSRMMELPSQRDAVYHNLGFVMARIEINMTMVRRLKVIQYLKDVPEVLDVPVPTPVFVLGLPRTGTTFLHRLLSLDPQVRAPLLWELLAPVPTPLGKASLQEHEADRKKRKEFVRKLIETRQSAGDHALSHIHEIGHDLPEECIMALTDEMPVLLQHFYNSYMNTDVFFEVNTPERVTRAYKWYRTILQMLSFQIGETKKPKRWMLKCPIHMFYTKEIGAAFPDAKIIWTHRHPVSAVPSLCSLLKSLHQVYYEPHCRDDAKLGRVLSNFSANLLEQTPKDIKASGLENVNVVYNELVKDPIAMVRSIYKNFNWEFSSEYESILNTFLVEDSKKREKQRLQKQSDNLHMYVPEEFSLTAEGLSSGKFAEYVKAFNVPMSKN